MRDRHRELQRPEGRRRDRVLRHGEGRRGIALTVGILTFEIHLPGAQGLKSKRQVVRRVRDRLRSRYNVAVAEVDDHGDLWQRAELMVVSVAAGRDALEGLFEGVIREAESHVPGTVIPTGTEFIEGADGGASGWSDDWS